MKCPFCKTELVKGEEKQYDTSADHAFDPNFEYERPMRETFVCPNSNCVNPSNKFWDDWGGFYGTTPRELYGKIISSAYGSGERKHVIKHMVERKFVPLANLVIKNDKMGWKKYTFEEKCANFFMKTGLYRIFGYEI